MTDTTTDSKKQCLKGYADIRQSIERALSGKEAETQLQELRTRLKSIDMAVWEKPLFERINGGKAFLWDEYRFETPPQAIARKWNEYDAFAQKRCDALTR